MLRRHAAPFLLIAIVVVYAAAVLIAAGPGAVTGWAAIAWSRTTGYLPALALVASIALMATMIADGRQGRERSVTAICRDFVATRIAPGYGLLWLMPLIAAVGSGTAYMIFKQRILPRTGFGADRMLADLDRALLGADAWTLSHRLLPGPQATWLLDLAYHPLFFPMTVGIALCLVLPLQSVARYRYMLGYALILIGPATIGSWLVPGVGPCFDAALHQASRYLPMVQTLGTQQAWLAASDGHGLVSFDTQSRLVALFRAGELADGAGISAMPSIHNALSTLFICFVVSLRPRLIWAMLPYGALILIGSVHLGWHYLVDSLAGIALAVGIWWGTAPIARMVGVGRAVAGARRPAPGDSGLIARPALL